MLVATLAVAVTGAAKTHVAAAVERHATRVVIGHGTPLSCTSAAVVSAVAKGGHISFDCGPSGSWRCRDLLREQRSQGKLFIRNSTLQHNLSDGFFTAGYPGVFYIGAGKPPVSHSRIS